MINLRVALAGGVVAKDVKYPIAGGHTFNRLTTQASSRWQGMTLTAAVRQL